MTRRVQVVILVAVLVGGALGGVAALTATRPSAPAKVVSQCDLPVSQRTGGWLCPEPTGTGGPDR